MTELDELKKIKKLLVMILKTLEPDIESHKHYKKVV